MLMPGERGDKRAAVRRAEGIPVPAGLWKELCDIAHKLQGDDALKCRSRRVEINDS